MSLEFIWKINATPMGSYLLSWLCCYKDMNPSDSYLMTQCEL